MTARIAEFLAARPVPTPLLVIDLDRVEQAYQAYVRAFGDASIYYAVKANPAPEIIARLVRAGVLFDAAGPDEIALCLAHGVSPERIAYGSTIKKVSDIAGARAAGVRRFAFDARSELHKIAEAAPGAGVLCRINADNGGAQWPLAGKFGCPPDHAARFLIEAGELGLDALGVSFHVGSQQLSPASWRAAIAAGADIFAAVENATGRRPGVLNIGGGFPVGYREKVASIEECAQTVAEAIDRSFGNRRPQLMLEPGRGLVAQAGLIETEIILIAEPGERDGRRWVYLDIGRFNGLAETAAEAICYPLTAPAREGRSAPVVLAGPTCDGADILYERADYTLPCDIRAGDRLHLHCAGAYTHSTSSIAYNGLRPLPVICI